MAINTDKTGIRIPRLEMGQAVLAKFSSLSTEDGQRVAAPTLRGKIVAVNHRHHHVTVEAEVRGGIVREGFKAWEVQVI